VFCFDGLKQGCAGWLCRVFHGRLRSDLRRAGSRTVSATFQRFECLQLDIKSREVGSVEDALNLYLSEETLTEGGFKGAKRMSLEVLPPVRVQREKSHTPCV
jgi:DNA-binding response OmpR family regulator